MLALRASGTLSESRGLDFSQSLPGRVPPGGKTDSGGVKARLSRSAITLSSMRRFILV